MDNGYDLGIDFESEVSNIRSDKPPQKKPPVKQQQQPAVKPGGGAAKPVQSGPANTERPAAQEPVQDGGTPNTNISGAPIVPVDVEGLGVSHAAETPGSDAKADVADTTEFHHEGERDLDWRKFKTLEGLFVHVGGHRPVQLAQNIKQQTVSGVLSPILDEIQQQLKDRFAGAIIHFPWGSHTIGDRNKVFTVKSSLMRYLMFDALRDGDGSHVQYAKQWLALNHTGAFDSNFRPDIHLKPQDDALDIYALLFIAHSVDVEDGRYDDRSKSVNDALDGYQIETLEQVQLTNTSMSRVIDMLNKHEDMLKRQSERAQMMQTVLLLDRMGLLKGGVPRDIEAFAGILEASRDQLNNAESIVDKHIDGERSRARNYAADQRQQNYNKQFK